MLLLKKGPPNNQTGLSLKFRFRFPGPATLQRLHDRRGEGQSHLPVDHRQEPQLHPLRGRRAGRGHPDGSPQRHQVRNRKLPRFVQETLQVSLTNKRPSLLVFLYADLCLLFDTSHGTNMAKI